MRALREYDHDIQKWWADFHDRPALSKEHDIPLLLSLGCSAAYSADPDGTPRLPFDVRSGELIPELWERWLAWDPVRMIDRYADALRSQRAIWIDAGTRDEWYLDLGATAFRDGLERIGVEAGRVHFELFPAGHGAIDYRYPQAIAWLAHRLAETG
ncbi:hypothetical protein [Actinoplanes sp. NBRC 103695]|uniref:hypothetical protein n=1 Tax=Actinoplanes sp. NBRC 103695 TaxID=3032202 RepID=UPI0024A0AE3D|nr:hypothetical protein [Actinoplanes sp. NBRC 103695]GLZ01931.1 hypothetical protein Acsp02_91820 [Actinoplanes sp. NBRC 103695]